MTFTKQNIWEYIVGEFPDLEKIRDHPGWNPSAICLYPRHAQLNISASEDGERIYMICMCLGKPGHEIKSLESLSIKVNEYLSHSCIPWPG